MTANIPKRKISYNGTPTKRKFHRIKKHYTILKRKIRFSIEEKQIRKYNNSLLNTIIDAIVMVKQSTYTSEDINQFKVLEKYSQQLQVDNTSISYEVFNSDVKREIKEIYKISASPKKWAQLLYCITKYTNSHKVLELGTNVGFSGAHILSALNTKNETFFTTMEGLPQLCESSANYFKTISMPEKFEVINGLYDNTFPELLQKNNTYDLFFIDGNHQKDPTIEYYQKLKKQVQNTAVFIFDDIYYSTEMTEAWNAIKNDQLVNYSIDMYKLGIIVIDKQDMNQNIPFELHLSY
jgi:predicted O-methyltransferase YrrM